MQNQVSSELFYPKLGAMQKTKTESITHKIGSQLLEIVHKSELSFNNIYGKKSKYVFTFNVLT